MKQINILVAIGANMPGPDGRSALATCIWAADKVAGIAGLREVGRSRWFGSPADPPSDQPDYVNGVVGLEGEIAPLALLAALQLIEAEGGRARSVPNAARTLDLDIVGLGELMLDVPGLVVPHPRMHLRPFVLLPLLDVAPGWRHPVYGAASTMLQACEAPDSAKPLHLQHQGLI